MKTKKRRIAIIIGSVLVVLIAAAVIFYLEKRGDKDTTPTYTKTINVGELKTDAEKAIKTISYPGATVLSKATPSDNAETRASFETTDSLEGAVNIYWQDLTNRYTSYKITKEEGKKDDALNSKSVIITVNGKSGKIIMTLWANKVGKTDIEIVTSNNFE